MDKLVQLVVGGSVIKMAYPSSILQKLYLYMYSLFKPGGTCQVSHVRGYIFFSCVMCHMSRVTCHMSLTPSVTATDPPLAISPSMHSRELLLIESNKTSKN